MKANLPNFLMVTHISRGKNDGEWTLAKARLNPLQITSYMEGILTNYEGQEYKPIVALFVAGQTYIVDMTIEEVDKMMESIDRSLSFNEE